MIFSQQRVLLEPFLFITDKLISPSGEILIPGIREAVAALSDEEWKIYQDIEFDVERYKEDIGISELMYNNKVKHRSVITRDTFCILV